VLVASSAIIPIFGFADWYYPLTDVLLYEDRFNDAYETTGDDRTILGMVGEGGALQSTMVLSKPALHEGFANETSKGNTGIHEFVHLLDKVDGATDGLPEYLLDKSHIKPWLELIHKSINDIKANHSDINPYGITNEAEFFAVVSEYFFKRPDLLEERHPELFARLEEIFHQNPIAPDKEVEG
jgi:Mlc titration factor MtfA (ptsG expression regulator)